jgi:four helix bundle protein
VFSIGEGSLAKRATNGVHVREAGRVPEGVDFADQFAGLTGALPRRYRFLVDQLNRALVSIAANIAEGNGRFTKADRKHFLAISRGSLEECVPLLELARRRELIDEGVHGELRSRLQEIARMLAGLVGGLDKRR